MKSLPVCAALALALAGCGDASAPSNEAAAAIRIENPGSDRLKALTPLNQRIGLMRAIRGNGKRCRRVERGAYQQDYQGMAMWVALCEDGRHWAIYHRPQRGRPGPRLQRGRQLGLPHCRPVPPMPPDPSAPPSTRSKAAESSAT